MPDDLPLLTVLLITYNHALFFEDAINSVLNQETTFSFVIHILDDASTDGTTALVESYAMRYPKQVIAYVNAENLGVEKNITQGLMRVRTKYFATLETDDRWSDVHKLEKQIRFLEQNPGYTMCGHNTWRCFVNGKIGGFTMFTCKAHAIKRIPSGFFHQKIIAPHPSSRVFVTKYLDFDSLEDKAVLAWDSTSYHYFLSQGPCMYFSDVMSVYNQGCGIYSSATKIEQRCMALRNILRINKVLGYRYDSYFTLKMTKILKMGWLRKIKFRFFLTREARIIMCHGFLADAYGLNVQNLGLPNENS